MFLVKTIKQAKKLMIAVIGFTVLAVGLALVVLPGPAILVIPAGLAILSIEFAWARNLLKRITEKLSKKKGTDPASNITATRDFDSNEAVDQDCEFNSF